MPIPEEALVQRPARRHALTVITLAMVGALVVAGLDALLRGQGNQGWELFFVAFVALLVGGWLLGYVDPLGGVF